MKINLIVRALRIGKKEAKKEAKRRRNAARARITISFFFLSLSTMFRSLQRPMMALTARHSLQRRSMTVISSKSAEEYKKQ